MAMSEGTAPAFARLRVIGAMIIRFRVSNPLMRPGVKRLMSGIVCFPLLLVDQESRHPFQKCPEELLRRMRELGFGHGLIHKLDPAVACSLVDLEWQMPRAQPRMSALLDISLRAPES